jgi:hypothetical protein
VPKGGLEPQQFFQPETWKWKGLGRRTCNFEWWKSKQPIIYLLRRDVARQPALDEGWRAKKKMFEQLANLPPWRVVRHICFPTRQSGSNSACSLAP